jgi:hypothetical protein
VTTPKSLPAHARSAKLRAAEAPMLPRSTSVEALLPRLPSLADAMRGAHDFARS